MLDVTQGRNLEILDRYNAEETLSSIGASYGITRERVRQIVEASGASPRRPTILRKARLNKALVEASKNTEKVIRQARIDKARKLIAGGMSKRRAAAEAGAPIHTLAKVASRHGRWRKELPILRAEAVILYDHGYTLAETARRIGMSVLFVNRALVSAGMPRRPRGRRRSVGNQLASRGSRARAMNAGHEQVRVT